MKKIQFWQTDFKYKVIITLKDQAQVSGEEIIGYCKERMANYKVPRCVEFVKSFDEKEVMKTR